MKRPILISCALAALGASAGGVTPAEETPRNVSLNANAAAGLLIAGDLDSDGDADLDDYSIFQGECFTGVGGSVSEGQCALADLDGDEDVDVIDWGMFQSAFTGDLSVPGMAFIPGGEFEMGRHGGLGGSDELPIHTVLVDSFYMDIYETTNQQFADALNWALSQESIYVADGIVYGSINDTVYCDTTSAPTAHSRVTWSGEAFGAETGAENNPVAKVTWHGAAAYTNWKSAQEGREPSYDPSTWACDFTANGYRLPTEAEWEYAARGGNHDPYFIYPWGDELLPGYANYWDSGDPFESGFFPWATPVGYYDGSQTPPGPDMVNGYGLYDMAGNMWEWCNDWHNSTYYNISPYDNPTGPAVGSFRITRGGSWHPVDGLPRCASRNNDRPDFRDHDNGFRIVLDR